MGHIPKLVLISNKQERRSFWQWIIFHDSQWYWRLSKIWK